MARELDLEDIGSPGSSINMPEEAGGDKEKKGFTIKLDIKTTKHGHRSVQVKEGQHITSLITPTALEELKHACLKSISESDGVDTKKVLEFIDSTTEFLENSNPTVKDMRSGNSRAVQLLFHFDEVVKGSKKIKRTWALENKPENWPVDVPFEDPNNGAQSKKDRTSEKCEKLRKDGLSKMNKFLRAEYLKRKVNIQEKRQEQVEKLDPTLQHSDDSPRAHKLFFLYNRGLGLVSELLHAKSTYKLLNKLFDEMYERAMTCAGEHERLRFAELCYKVQETTDNELLKDKPDRAALSTNLLNIYERYKAAKTDNAVQPVSTDTPELHAIASGVRYLCQSTSTKTPVLPSPVNNWNHLAYQQVQVQQPVQQPQTVTLTIQEAPIVPQEPEMTSTQPLDIAKQPDILLQLAQSKIITDSDNKTFGSDAMPPNTTLKDMTNSNNYYSTPASSDYMADMDFGTSVMSQGKATPAVSQVQMTPTVSRTIQPSTSPAQEGTMQSGKRKSVDDVAPVSGKVYVSLSNVADLPPTNITSATTHSEAELVFEWLQGNDINAADIVLTQANQQDLNHIITPDTVVPGWEMCSEQPMDVEL